MSSTFKRPVFKLVGESPSTNDSNIRSLPDLLEFNSIHNPSHLFCIQALSQQDESKHHLRRITFEEFDTAVHRCCRWIERHVGSISEARNLAENRQPIALFIESNIGLFTFVLALLSLNIPCVLLSFRLSPAAVQSLIDKTSTKYVISSSRGRPVVEAALNKNQPNGTDNHETVHILNPPHFATFFDEGDGEVGDDHVPNGVHLPNGTHAIKGAAFPHRERRPVCSLASLHEDDKKVIVLHSSGTTGLPKPIFLTHRYLLGYAGCHELLPGEVEGRLNMSTLPLYHGFGLLAPCLALSTGMPVCLPSSTQIPTGDSTIAIMSSLRPSSLMTVPSILEDIVTVEDTVGFQVLRTLDFVAVGGGPIKPTVGKVLVAQGIKLLNHYGATELGALAPIFKPDESYDWRYLRLRTNLGLQLRSLDPSDPNSIRCKVSGVQFGYPERFEVQDELERNPLNPQKEVRILGRADDLIVLATGEKFHPRPLEESLSNHPGVRKALAFGDSQFEIGVIIEPSEHLLQGTEQNFIDNIWPTILKINDSLDSHGRISSKSAIIITRKDKTLPTSDKGSPMRKECYALYAEEIEAAYKNLDDAQASQLSMGLTLSTLEDDLRAMIQNCLAERLALREWSSEDDFFSLGMDSLQATRFRRMLNAAVITNREEFGSVIVNQTFVHKHPSVAETAKALRHPNQSAASTSDRRTRIFQMADLYISQMPKEIATSGASSSRTEIDQRVTVLLTGSTGNIGAYLLECLCRNPSVRQVICLLRKGNSSENVGDSARRRQEKAQVDRNIILSREDWAKVQFMEWQMGTTMLGLTNQEYDHLVHTVTHVFHAAWPMDFERTLASFKPQMRVMTDLIELARKAHAKRPEQRPRVTFASSIAAIGGHRSKTGRRRFPETVVDDPTVSLNMGYGEAKWICEKIVQHANSTFKDEIEVAIIRIGQISGSKTTGSWSQKEHIPALIKLSKSAGLFPNLTGSASWLPVDTAASVIEEIILDSRPADLVYHVENPVRQSWTDIAAIMRDRLGLTSSESRVSLEQWVDRVAKRDDMPQGLVTFFNDEFEWMSNGSLVLDTHNSRRSSATLRSVGGVGKSLIESYVGCSVATGQVSSTLN